MVSISPLWLPRLSAASGFLPPAISPGFFFGGGFLFGAPELMPSYNPTTPTPPEASCCCCAFLAAVRGLASRKLCFEFFGGELLAPRSLELLGDGLLCADFPFLRASCETRTRMAACSCYAGAPAVLLLLRYAVLRQKQGTTSTSIVFWRIYRTVELLLEQSELLCLEAC
mmetsp:Transcript_70734/g.197790  ORF Transcript_70734/g.197790 Transcript_70734/m.197790 type:complete len:170 (-) Transcript_70734:110-619(-)